VENEPHTPALRPLFAGTIRWFDPYKRFGFIEVPGRGEPDVLFHESSIQPPHKFTTHVHGVAVEFELLDPEPKRGPKAGKVWVK
jgi:cold shock CspA family protein